MRTVAEHLTGLVAAAAAAAGHADAPVPLEPCVATRDAAHGDYQSNFAFRLGKALRTNPRAVAQAVVDAFPEDAAVAAIEVAGPGFINIRLASEWLASRVQQLADDPRLGAPKPNGRTMVIDYSAPNIAKRMHVAHLRSTVIGAAVHQLYKWLGWTVIADNHLGDWGTPVGKLIVGWNRYRDEAAYADDPVGELQRLYQRVTAECASDPEVLDDARAETVKLQRRDPRNIALWEQFMANTMEELDRVYARLGVSFDVVLGESAYKDELQDLVDGLLASGTAVHSKGATVVPFEVSDGKGLTDRPLLVRKADGSALYGTTDLATIRHRVNTWDPERIVYVVDTRQQLHFRQVFAAARKMGLAGPQLIHVWFGMLSLQGGVVVGTRSGNVINLVDLLDTAAEHAFGVVTDKSPELPEDERRAIAEAVGVGAVKYFDLSQNPQSDIEFSWERALSHDSGSSVYLQYGYARLHRILDAGGASVDTPLAALPAVSHPAERALAVLVARTPEAIAVAAEAYRPNLLADHLEQLATAVGPFYQQCPVLKDGVDPQVRAGRLALVRAVARALAVGLELLGIRVVSRM